MYNKLFGKILRSSIWCEDYPTRIVWIAFLASMDEDGMVDWAAPRIVALIAGVTVEEAEKAIAILEAPDPASANQEHEGRRIERFPGGWHVLNCQRYKDLATRDEMRRQSRERMRKARQGAGRVQESSADVRDGYADVRNGYADVRNSCGSVTLSETETDTRSETEARSPIAREKTARSGRDGFESFWGKYPKKVARQAASKAWTRIPASVATADIMAGLDRAMRSEQWLRDGGQYVPHAATWLNGSRWSDDLPAAAGAVAGQTTPAPVQQVDPIFGVPVPFTRGGVVWWSWYDWITHQATNKMISMDEWHEAHVQKMAYLEARK